MRVLLAPHQSPGTIFTGVLSECSVSAVVVGETHIQVVGVTDVELAKRILEDIDVVHRLEPRRKEMAPEAGLEPATRRLTAGCSTIELLWNPIFRFGRRTRNLQAIFWTVKPKLSASVSSRSLSASSTSVPPGMLDPADPMDALPALS